MDGFQMPPGAKFVTWCSGCSAEEATETLEVEWNGRWINFPVGVECLTRAQENDIIEE